MTKKVLLMCAGGMSSSLMAKKVTEYLKENKHAIEVTATGIGFGKEELKKKASYDLYLVSPQVRMYFDAVEKLADNVSKSLVQVKGPEYIPVPKGIQAMATLILKNLP